MAMRWTPDVSLAEEGLGCLGIRWGKEGGISSCLSQGRRRRGRAAAGTADSNPDWEGANDVAQTWHTQSQLAFHSSYSGT